MTLNAGIILAGQQPDILGALRQGTEAGMLANQATKQNALTSLYAQDGAGIVAGDPGAINRLAGLDPMAALGVQGAQLDMQATQGRMTALANEDKRRIAELAASMDAEKAAATAADTAEDLRVMAAVTDPAQWDQVVVARGLPELVGKFDQRAPILAQSAEAFTAFQEGMKPKASDLNLPSGYMEDPANPGTAMRIPGIEDEKPAVDLGAVDDLRKEYGGLAPVKSFAVQADMFGKVVAAAKDPSAAGDLALIFSFMKILDPNSVVREQEFANAQNAAGVPDQVRNMWNKLLEGERLNPEQRADFLNQAFKVYKSAEQNIGAIEGQYKGIAETRGLPLDQSIIDYRYNGPISGPELGAAGIGGTTVSAPTTGASGPGSQQSVSIDGQSYVVEAID